MTTFETKIILFFTIIMMSISVEAVAQVPGSITDEEEPAAAVEVNFTENPCPEPKQALSQTPNDLKVIQEDITRFNLCLQRAQLLSRLNDLSVENVDTINSTLDEKLQNIAGDFKPMPMPEIQMPVMPEMAASELMADEPMPQMAPQPIIPQTDYSNWSIDNIKGKNGILVATLSDIDGNIAVVKSGEVIPETEITITSVTQTGVKVSENEESGKLRWKQ